MQTTTILAYIGTVFSTTAVIPQIIRVLRIKNAHALSYSFFLLRGVAFAMFGSAMLCAKEYGAASSYLFVISANVYLAFLKYYYDNIYPKKHPKHT